VSALEVSINMGVRKLISNILTILCLMLIILSPNFYLSSTEYQIICRRILFIGLNDASMHYKTIPILPTKYFSKNGSLQSTFNIVKHNQFFESRNRFHLSAAVNITLFFSINRSEKSKCCS